MPKRVTPLFGIKTLGVSDHRFHVVLQAKWFDYSGLGGHHQQPLPEFKIYY